MVTPLTWDVFRATLLNDAGMVLDGSSAYRREQEGVMRIHGRAYIRLDGLLDTFCYLPKITPRVVGQVLGVDLPPAVQTYIPPAGLAVRLAQGAFVLDALGLVPRLAWMARRMPPPPAAVRGNLVELLVWTTRCFRLHLKCTAYAIGAFGFLRDYLDRWAAGKAEASLPQMVAGGEDMQTAAQGLSLWRLAEQVRANTSLQQFLLQQTLPDDLDWSVTAGKLADVDGGPEFFQAFQAFMEANGARAANEFELATPRWREAPSFVLAMLLKFVHAQRTEGRPPDSTEQPLGEAAIAPAPATSTPLRRAVLTRLRASYSVYTTVRENMKYRLMEGYALLRHVLLDVGNDLVSEGLLDNAQDVFFLTLSEALAPVTGDDDGHRLRQAVLARKVQHSQWESQTVPDLVVGNGHEFLDSQDGALTGIGCSPGTVEGVARVLLDISEMDTLQPGEILVAPHTDPGWTPLFLICKAVITEVGGFLSHGATVAREYGVPAVVNVKGATKRIHTGDLVRVDGTGGRVVVYGRSPEP